MSVPHDNNRGMATAGAKRRRKGPRGKFGDMLRATRAARGLTQEAAARALGVTRAALARWESGLQRPGPMARRVIEGWCSGRLEDMA